MCTCVSHTYLRNKLKVPPYPFNDHKDTLCPRLSALALRSDTSVKPQRRRGTCCGVVRNDNGAKAVLCMRTRILS